MPTRFSYADLANAKSLLRVQSWLSLHIPYKANPAGIAMAELTSPNAGDGTQIEAGGWPKGMRVTEPKGVDS